ncbi:hypothetical protein QBC42DRAFT_180465 [Cladorrhinum samala]|uniref:F-box domain-containing protein n=1 Tax=Cladorrhinum samala TaxID=585594 RepID=A0AAV9HL09_9PEZI|nr:hypothetical protein QBC42DRAFT_180465 [Cladorrhinum samala]
MEPITSSSLTSLPTELIAHIASFLRPKCCTHNRPGCHYWSRGQTPLSRLSRTCKRLASILQPSLFLCFPDHHSDQVRRLVHLARTLMARPDLAQRVRFLMMGQLDHDSLPTADATFVQSTVTELQPGNPVPSWWDTDGDPQYRLLALELVLAHTPSLEYLRIPLDYDWRLEFLHGLGSEFSLPALRSLEVSHYFIAGDRFDISLDAVETIAAAAPNLEFLSIPSPNAYNADGPFGNLRALDLQSNNAVCSEVLSDFASKAPKLERFALQWDGFSYEDDAEDRRAVDAWNALEKRRDTLREVDVNALSPLRAAWRRNNRHAKEDSFLSGMLPESIREVTLWNLDVHEYTEAVRRLAKVVGFGRYPALKSVVVAKAERSDRDGFYNQWNGPGAWWAMREELKQEFAKGGVAFEVKLESDYWRGLLKA